jgi:hypothetical protein
MLIILLAVTGLAPLHAEDRKPRKLALLIGPSTYLHGFTTLNYLDDDVKALAKELRDCGFDDVTVLTGKPEEKRIAATKAHYMARLQKLLNGDGDPVRAVRKGDIVLLAFSGHGQEIFSADGKSKETFFAPIDGKPLVADTLINLREVFEALSAAGSKNLILADMCREISDANKSKGIDTVNLKMPTNSAIFFGCESSKQSFVNEAKKHSLFTYAVLETLRSARAEGRELTWTELVVDVEKRFRSAEFKGLMGPNSTQTPVERRVDLATPILLEATAPPPVKKPAPKPIDTTSKTTSAPPPLQKDDKSATVAKPGEVRTLKLADSVTLEFCWIPPVAKGQTRLGSPTSDINRFPNEIEHAYDGTDGFWLGRTELTQEQWQSIMANNPSEFSKTGAQAALLNNFISTRQFPVENVSWNDCQASLSTLNKKNLPTPFGKAGRFVLPSADDWEYACRGGSATPYHWGDEIRPKLHANCAYLKGEGGLGRTDSVGTCAKHAPHPWNLADMSGNVWEWCDTPFDKDKRIACGGAYNTPMRFCRSAVRAGYAPATKSPSIGVRLCFKPQ